MKISTRDLPAFLRNLQRYRVVLLHGEDAGAIRERGSALTKAVAGSANDPQLVVEMRCADAVRTIDGTKSHTRLAEEAMSLPMTDGRRVVRLHEATDAATPHVKDLLSRRAPALIILEAGQLPARSTLRALTDADPQAASVACYPEEGATLAETIRRTLRATNVGVTSDAVTMLLHRLGGDRMATKAEVEKLSLYAGAGGTVDVDAVTACTGDLSGASLDDALFAATTGDVETADRALELALSEGETPVGALRAGLMHLQRLHQLRLAMDANGTSADETIRTAKPPIFFRRVDASVRALRLWPADDLLNFLDAFSTAERDCKRTGWPDETLARHAVLMLATGAAERSYIS